MLERYIRTDLEQVAAVRKDNYAWLLQRFGNVDGVEVLYPAIGDQVPHDFPIRIGNGLREKLYFALMEQNLPTIALYYRMAPPEHRVLDGTASTRTVRQRWCRPALGRAARRPRSDDRAGPRETTSTSFISSELRRLLSPILMGILTPQCAPVQSPESTRSASGPKDCGGWTLLPRP